MSHEVLQRRENPGKEGKLHKIFTNDLSSFTYLAFRLEKSQISTDIAPPLFGLIVFNLTATPWIPTEYEDFCSVVGTNLGTIEGIERALEEVQGGK